MCWCLGCSACCPCASGQSSSCWTWLYSTCKNVSTPNWASAVTFQTASSGCNAYVVQWFLAYSQICAAITTAVDDSPHLKNPGTVSPHPLSPTSMPYNQESTFCLCRPAYPGHFIQMESLNMCSFVANFFHLV